MWRPNPHNPNPPARLERADSVGAGEADQIRDCERFIGFSSKVVDRENSNTGEKDSPRVESRKSQL